MITIHKDAPPDVKKRNARLTCVGVTEHHIRLVDPETTCLKRADVVWVAFGEINYGLCRLPKGHNGDCADSVWYCDACDGVYSDEDETVERFGNAEVTICGRCQFS